MATIGITACRKLEDYRQAVLHAGGDVRVLEPGTAPELALEGVHGLLLTGGEDVDPALYGEEPHPTVEINPERDRFEIALIKAAQSADLPIFAICRGIQVLNVALGGTLVQDIASQVPGSLNHFLTIPPHHSMELAHEVWVDKDTLLARVLRERLNDSDSCEVNSRHHQAVKAVAPGLRASATAPDGIIEAIEDPARPFCLGVQWHPENFWRTGEFRALFEGFIEAASAVAAGSQ
jgi:putative glutamine amidotransferase